MKIAIHHRPKSFSERWITYCHKKQIPYKLVNAFDNDIVSQLQDCDAMMWHHDNSIYKDVVAAKKILFALEHAGIKVFPNFRSAWHFDDKVAQKYLLEAIGAPLVPSHVFYNKQDAVNWAKQTSYPKVFKLKGGDSAANVRLINSQTEAIRLIKKAFGRGFPQYNRLGSLKERYRKFLKNQASFLFVIKGLARFFITTDFAKQQPNERGYIYFQDFLPGNNSDIRIIVIDNKAFAIKRFVRKNDFRASGSGTIEYERKAFDERCVRIAFDITKRLNAQSLAYDFVYDKDNTPLIIEISYGFVAEVYDQCPGYWDHQLNWHEENFVPQDWMVDLILKNS